MLSITEIERFYPENQRPFKRNILREYLQYQILQIIFDSKSAAKLAFMGGTCLRICFGTNRFSEDLDFDNFGLSIDEFDALAGIVAKKLEDDGYIVEIKTVHKGAFRCYIRIPRLLFDNKLSGYQEERILIQLDTEAQGFQYQAESFIMNKFDIVTRIFHTPKEILLSQKLWAILNRKTLKGRDIYDAMFLFSLTKPDYAYLEIKAGIINNKALTARIEERLNNVDLKQLDKDIQPFLINPSEHRKDELFLDYVRNSL